MAKARLQPEKSLNVARAIQQALAAHQQGRLPQAEQLYADVLAVRPDYFEALHRLGLIKLQRGELADALRLMASALKAKPKSVEVLLNHGRILNALNRHDEALASFDQVLTVKPNSPEAHYSRGAPLVALGRNDEALAAYRRALALKPDYAQAHFGLGTLLSKLARSAEALESFERCIESKPNFHKAHYNRGNTLERLGRYDEALKCMHRALAIKPDYAEAHWNSALVLLRLGDFEAGLKEYEWRQKTADRLKHQRPFTQPLWLGETPLSGKTILVHAEQGLGDTIQCVRYAPMLAAQGARVILEVQPALKNLLSRAAGASAVIARREQLPAFDCHCPFLSLPLALGTRLDSIPADIPYLTARDDKRERWRELLPKNAKRRIGIVWSGNAAHMEDRNRSIALSQLAPLLALPDIQWVSLQKEIRTSDAPALQAHPEIFDASAHLTDFEETAAAIAELDLVISVDTSVAHLAGALGKPVWILIAHRPDWRWMLERADSPWYPTVRLFRQSTIGEWGDVLARIACALREG